ncbi:LysM domain-containing protein [Chitinispirillales bacterium ANBcel5]|uniref:LysM peptidoglycan-binding domain-containing protein n=1 Tax=Cellulosispirillum alkaliphilum TaxID=3039283 RepID=UPI002A4FBD3B|nr:LysM domain-containing protein [Chitinispirillales bacterium ANBcel5]
MKQYTVKDGEDLGSIARKFWLASWKYLYEINKDIIGDNPDLLKPGTKLKIPQWNDTQGDEKIEAKGGKVREYVNGLRYAYVWVPFSMSLMDRKGRPLQENTDAYKFTVLETSQQESRTIYEKVFSKCDEIGALVPFAHNYETRVELNKE